MKNVGELTNQMYASMLEEREREQDGMCRVASPFLQVTNNAIMETELARSFRSWENIQ